MSTHTWTQATTLVLNRVWMAVGKVSWRNAFLKICSERAEVLEYYDETVKTPSKEMFIPAVIRLLNYDKLPLCKVIYSKRTILERDNFQCQYCEDSLTISSATMDHVVPRTDGGKSTFENTVASCSPCNNKKGSKPLSSLPFTLKSKPYKPKRKTFRLRLNNLMDEWKDYLPRKLLNEFQTNDWNNGWSRNQG